MLGLQRNANVCGLHGGKITLIMCGWMDRMVAIERGQIGDCVTTAGRRPWALGFAVCSVIVYIARTLGVGGGNNTCQSNEKAPGFTS